MTTQDQRSQLTASTFRHLVHDAGAELGRAGVTATFAWTVGGRRSPGATWISLSSKQGYGRLVRHSDGTFRSDAHNRTDGNRLFSSQGPDVTRQDFVDLVDSLASPPVLDGPNSASRHG
jgi:hypothetical protein